MSRGRQLRVGPRHCEAAPIPQPVGMPHADPALTRSRIRALRTSRLALTLGPPQILRLQTYLQRLVEAGVPSPGQGEELDWRSMSARSGVPFHLLSKAARHLRPILLDIRAAASTNGRCTEAVSNTEPSSPTGSSGVSLPQPVKRRRGARPQPVIEHPRPLQATWEEPSSFSDALALHMRRHADTSWRLWRALAQAGFAIDVATLGAWRRGAKAPRASESLAVLNGVEHRYRLPRGYFAAKLPHPSRIVSGPALTSLPAAERRRIAWHLPDDFDRRSPAEQEEILVWVRRVILTGSTEYRSYQAEEVRTRFALRFPGLDTAGRRRADTGGLTPEDCGGLGADEKEPRRPPGPLTAPPRLAAEMARLLAFKTSTLAPPGHERSSVWNGESAMQRLEHISLLLGALSAAADGPVRGRGLPLTQVTLALLVFPSVWDWYLGWRERKRGFYTQWEVDMLRLGQGLTRRDTGWLRQSPDLAAALEPCGGLVSSDDVQRARDDWNGACDIVHAHALTRAKEVQRVARVHRDPFEAILPVLEAESPVGEYRKIVDEIRRRMPDERLYPKARAEAVRALLMLRFGLHLGLRQKNLRQLLLRPGMRGLLRTSTDPAQARRAEVERTGRRLGGLHPPCRLQELRIHLLRKQPLPTPSARPRRPL